MNDKPHYPDISINIFEQIDSICREFRRQWKQGNDPAIEDCLERAPTDAQSNLFLNLLNIEIEYRRRGGDQPTSDEYIQRFPKFSQTIRQAFFEDTMMSIEVQQQTPAAEPGDGELFANHTRSFNRLAPDEGGSSIVEMPAARRLGEYELVSELGRGGFGVVYKARHLQRNNLVALKTLPTGGDGQEQNAERLHKFRREFRSLSEINHPNLVGMQTLEVDGSQWFLTMDLIRGEQFLSYVRPNNELNDSRLRDVTVQLAKAIIALHERNIVHRDLKPSNVLVEPDGQVVILDFGLVSELQHATDQTASMRSAMFAGTPRYAAPEQLFGERSEASDWYAMGVMLYEALTGDPPFDGKPMEVLQKKQNEDPPSLASRAEIPSELAELTDRLLRRDAKQRPNSLAVAKALSLDLDSESHGSVSVESGSFGSQGQKQFLIGRETQLEQLNRAKQELCDKCESLVVFIRGRSGEGKSSLAEAFLEPIRLGKEILVLSGRCYDRESVPFKALDSLIDALVAFLRSSKFAETLLPADIHMLAHLFPILRRVEAIANRTSSRIIGLSDRQIRYRAFAALRELLENISKTTPVIVFVDDLQWGDADSAFVLFDLLVPPNPPAVMFLGSYRSDELENSPFLQQWEKFDHFHLNPQIIEVEPLTEEQCVSFLVTRFGREDDLTRKLASDLFTSTQGNPYFVEQLLEGYDSETGSLETVPLMEIIDRKLKRLSPDAVDMLQLIAIAGRSVTVLDALEVAGQDPSVHGLLTHMRNERLIRLLGTTDQQQVDTYHDKIRETILIDMDHESRRDLHLRFAEMIENAESSESGPLVDSYANSVNALEEDLVIPARVAELAFHFNAAEDRRGFAYQLFAGEQAYRAYALEDALAHLKKAAETLPEDVSADVRCRLNERTGSLLGRTRQFELARKHYQMALRYAPNAAVRSRLQYGIGVTYQYCGENRETIDCFDKALAELEIYRPRGLQSKIVTLLHSFRVFLIPIKWQRLRRSDRRAIAELKSNLFHDLFLNLAEEANQPTECSYALFRQAADAKQSGKTNSLVSAFCLLAAGIAIQGMPWLARRILRKWLAVARQADDLDSLIYISLWSAHVTTSCGKLNQSLREFDFAARSARKAGLLHIEALCAHFARHHHAVVSSSAIEIETARHELSLAEPNKALQPMSWAHYGIANGHARRGDLNTALNHMQRAMTLLKAKTEGSPYSKFHVTKAVSHRTFGFVWLQCSEYQKAQQQLKVSLASVNDQVLILEYVIRTIPLLIESKIGPNWMHAFQNGTPRDIQILCRRANRMSWHFPNLRCVIHRALGRVESAQGNNRKAVRRFDRAVKAARKMEIKYDLAKSLLDLAAVKEEGREANRTEAIELLKEMESVIPLAESWLLDDQYDETVVAPEFDLEAWEQENGSVASPAEIDA